MALIIYLSSPTIAPNTWENCVGKRHRTGNSNHGGADNNQTLPIQISSI